MKRLWDSRRTSERRAVREAGVLPPIEERDALPVLTRGFLPPRATFWPAERDGPACTVVWRRAIVGMRCEGWSDVRRIVARRTAPQSCRPIASPGNLWQDAHEVAVRVEIPRSFDMEELPALQRTKRWTTVCRRGVVQESRDELSELRDDDAIDWVAEECFCFSMRELSVSRLLLWLLCVWCLPECSRGFVCEVRDVAGCG